MTRAAVLSTVVLWCGLVAAACSDGPGEVEDRAVVEVFGPWRGVDADRFAEVLAPFEDDTGIEVRYVGSVDFVADLLARTGDGNDPPDVAMVPQPALVRQLAAAGHILPLEEQLRTTIVERFGAEGAGLGAIDSVQYGVPYRVTVKSLVWYRPEVFAERGWSIPGTLDELTALVDRIESDSEVAPWCLGINAGSATGWVVTDWIEDLVLRSIGADRYQQWARGGIAFADPAIADAFERFRALALEPGRTSAGIREIVATPVDRAILPLLDDPPACAMHRQADFAESWLPDGTTIGPDGDVDVFVLPGASDGPPPLVVGGTQAVRFGTGADVDAVMDYLATPRAAAIWAERGGFLSLNRLVSADTYPDDHLRRLTAAVDRAPAIVFDASDQMPPAIGADLLWDGVTAWVAGTDDYATFARMIDEARAADDPP